MTRAHKIANSKHEESARITTRGWSHHGTTSMQKKIKRKLNQIAKRRDAALDMKEQTE